MTKRELILTIFETWPKALNEDHALWGPDMSAVISRQDLMNSFHDGTITIDDAVQAFVDSLREIIGRDAPTSDTPSPSVKVYQRMCAQMEEPKPTYDGKKLVAMLKQAGDYREQLIKAVQYLQKHGQLGTFSDWLEDSYKNHCSDAVLTDLPPTTPEEQARSEAQWEAWFKTPVRKQVRINYDDQPDEVARKFYDAVNFYRDQGISCEEIHCKDGETHIDYDINVERWKD